MLTNNSSNNTRIAKNTLMLYIRMFLTMMIALYTSRIVLGALGVEDYGIYNVVGGVVAMLSFFNSSMATSTQRYLNVEMGKGNLENLNKVFISAIHSHIIIAVLTIATLELFCTGILFDKLTIPPERLDAAITVFHIAVASLFVSIVGTPYGAVIIANEKMSIYAYVSIFESLLRLIIIYLLVISPFDKLISYVVLQFLVTAGIQVFYLLYCGRFFKECKYRFIWDNNLIKRLFSFTGWMLFGCMSDMLGNQGVNILINIFFGPVYNAARGIAVQIKTAIDTFVQNFLTAVKPQIMKSYAAGDYSYTYRLVYSASRLSFYLLFILTLPVFFNTHYILEVWLKNVPPYCELFTQLTLMELLIRTSYAPIAQINQASGKVRNYQIAISILFLFTFVSCYILFKLNFPVYTAFIVAVIVAVVGLLVRLEILRHDCEFPALEYVKKVFAPIMPVFLVSSILPFIHSTNNDQSFSHFLLNSLLCVFCSCVSIWFLGISKSEKILLIDKVKPIINKFYDKN